MAVTELSSALVTPFPPRRRAPERRAQREPPTRDEPEPPVVAVSAASEATPESNFYAALFRADLSALSSASARPAPAASAVPSAPSYFEHLGALIAAVRAGDLVRARAAAESLETEVLVERSAGEPAPSWLLAAERVQSVARAAPEPAAAEVDKAYETLSHYLDPDGPIV